MITLDMVTIDTTDARTLADWWAERLGGKVAQDFDGWFCMVEVPGSSVTLGFQKVADPTPGKNRMHFDLSWDATTDRQQMIGEWVAAGATHIETRGDADFQWDTFTDPAGNEFCIGDPH